MNSYIEKEALSRLCTINGSDRGFYKHAEQDIIQMPPIIISVLTIFFITINLKTHKTYLYSRLIIFYVLAFVKCFDHFCLIKEPDISLSAKCPVFVFLLRLCFEALQFQIELLDAPYLVLRVEEGFDYQRVKMGPGVFADDIKRFVNRERLLVAAP